MTTQLAVAQGRWRIERRLGGGSGGEVYLATDLSSGEACALKAVGAIDAALEARLRWEFTLLGRVNHPALVRPLDLVRSDGDGPWPPGQLFFTTQFVEGVPIAEYVAASAPRQRGARLLELLSELAAALAALHRSGIIHGDVKPANLLVDRDGRLRLVDLGLAVLSRRSIERVVQGGDGAIAASIRGTIAYLAPEALVGTIDARTDLYAVGATVFELWCGSPPHGGGSAIDVAAAILRATETPSMPDLEIGRAGRTRSIPAPPALRRVVSRLLERDPERRYPSAVSLVEDLRRVDAALHGLALPPPSKVLLGTQLFGREEPLVRTVEALERALAMGSGRKAAVGIIGARGSGRSRLSIEAMRQVQIRAAATGKIPLVHGPTAEAALRSMAVPHPASSTSDSLAVEICSALSRRPAILHLSEVNSPLSKSLLRAASLGAIAPSVVLFEAEPNDPLLEEMADTVTPIALGSLSEGDAIRIVRAMNDALTIDFARAIFRYSRGLPLRIVSLVQSAVNEEFPPSKHTVRRIIDRGDDASIAGRIAQIEPGVREVIIAVAALGGEASPSSIGTVLLEPLGTVLERLGIAEGSGAITVTRDGELVARLIDPSLARAVERGVDARRRRTIRRRAITPLLEAAELAKSDVNLPKAIELLQAALASGAVAYVRRSMAELQIAVGDYPGAIASIGRARDPASRLVQARAMQRAGRTEEAERRLRHVLRSAGREAKLRDEALSLLGRLLIDHGSSEEALVLSTRGHRSTASAALLEIRGRAYLDLGRIVEAERSFVEMEAASVAQSASAIRGRATALLGLVAQRRARLIDAAAAYDRAERYAIEGHDHHGASIYAQNLGAVCRDLADYRRALPAIERAALVLARIGKAIEHAGALANLANLLLAVGDLDGAARAHGEAERLVRSPGALRLAPVVRSIGGDLLRREGKILDALVAYRDASAMAQRLEDSELTGWIALAEAELQVEAGRAPLARRASRRVVRTLARPLSDATAIVDVRIALLEEEIDEADVALLDRIADQAREERRSDTAFRARVVSARAWIFIGNLERAQASIAQARAIWESIRMQTPEIYSDRIDGDPDARRLATLIDAAARAGAGAPREGSAGPSVPAGPLDPRRDRLLAIQRRLAEELRLEPLLELIVDAVIELTHAERGFVLLGSTGGEGDRLEVTVARNIDRRSLDDTERSLSRSIAERAAHEGAPIVTLDAAGDDRFGAARSVADLKLRSVLAVPLIARGEVVGCIYVDHRLRTAAFGEADSAIAVEFAELAAIAVSNARLVEENLRQRRELEIIAAERERQIDVQRVELGELVEQVRQNSAALEVRYDYRNLVGRTPPMLELFRLLDRVTDTHLPVVIHGESGTGKELVARAIHFNGPRKRRPFITESCAAIPETLLEAALFGHTRGAFTGAEGERRGLFEIADGGTLFLDEIGETSPAMQAKLLRVLQEGEFRRIGGERTRKVDVRMLVASNRDLGRLVEEGRFREDLYFRLNVVRVALPALRERRDDIPLLVEHFLRRQAERDGSEPKRIVRGAIHRLIGYRWPGNVRELENEILRAGALGGALISIQDLSPHIAAGEAAAPISPNDLRLRERIERLERTLIMEALGRSRGNQSQAARLLGLSRFGLQKKLKRYGIAP